MFSFWLLGREDILDLPESHEKLLQPLHMYPETVSNRGDGSLHSHPGTKGVMRSLAGIWGWRQEGL